MLTATGIICAGKHHRAISTLYCNSSITIISDYLIHMATLSSEHYKATRKIMLGKAAMNPHFQPLANWIKETYGILPVNICCKVIEKRKQTELEIFVERESERAMFYTKDQFTFNKNKQQAIIRQFQWLMQQQGISQYNTENIWVTCCAFEILAKAEANENIPGDAIRRLKEELSAEGLWEISVCFGYTTFFVYTRQQVKEMADSAVLHRWTDAWFQLLKQYDTFDYFERESFKLVLDSKENFDTTYQGNWYYYYK